MSTAIKTSGRDKRTHRDWIASGNEHDADCSKQCHVPVEARSLVI